MKSILIYCLVFPTIVSHAAVVLRFDFSGEGVLNQPSLTFEFRINDYGTVSLDASTASRNAEAIAAVDKWDDPAVAKLEDKSLFGKRFLLRVFAENQRGGYPPIAMWADDGGVLGVGGHNARRIDGQVVKAGQNLERMVWVLEGDVVLKVLNFACGSGVHNGGIIMEGPQNELRTGAMKKSTTANWNIPEGRVVLSDGQQLVFKADPELKNGAGLAGLVFEVEGSK